MTAAQLRGGHSAQAGFPRQARGLGLHRVIVDVRCTAGASHVGLNIGSCRAVATGAPHIGQQLLLPAGRILSLCSTVGASQGAPAKQYRPLMQPCLMCVF